MQSNTAKLLKKLLILIWRLSEEDTANIGNLPNRQFMSKKAQIKV